MKGSVVGKVIIIILAVLMLVVTPLYLIGIVQWARADQSMQYWTANLVDKVRDTRTLTDDMLADYNLALASLPVNYYAEIVRETSVVNPDPLNPGQTRPGYLVADDISTWEQGDTIIVTVKTFGANIMTTIASKFLGLDILNSKFVLPAEVR